ncbi:MAG: DUF5668 domain-containing protein [Bryobacteraceae bacterium]|nr:DUF5668 domain-containing protein [Bryobacteraceae bacterium]
MEETIATTTETPAESTVGFCRTCGVRLTDSTKRLAYGTLFCAEHVPVTGTGPVSEPPSPYAASPGAPGGAMPANVSAGLAFILGLIPGVGAIYNGQYAKGFVHALVFGLLVSISSSDELAGGLEPVFGMLSALWVFYMAFEAYHTAKRRALGEPVDEFSSVMPLAGRGGVPFAPILLIVLGVLFLLSNFGLLRLSQLMRFWPVLLIVLGAGMLLNRVRGAAPESPKEFGRE